MKKNKIKESWETLELISTRLDMIQKEIEILKEINETFQNWKLNK